jgi:hypothetical protein
MKLNVPLVVPVNWQMASGSVSLGITEQAFKAVSATNLVKAKYQHVLEWRPGDMLDHGSLDSKPPMLVMYAAYNNRIGPIRGKIRWPDRDDGGTQNPPYLAPVPALLCSSRAAANQVFTLCESYAKCAYCGKPFTPIRKDQTCCTPQHSALKRARRAYLRRRRK